MNASVQMMAAPYVPSASQAKALPDIADALHTQLCKLACDPNLTDATNLAVNLGGAQRAILRLCEALRREQEAPDGTVL